MAEALIHSKSLLVGSKGRYASGWWGMVALIGAEAALFSYLFFSYYYLASHALGPWPPQGPPDLTIALPGTLILIAGSISMWWGERGIERGKLWQLKVGLILSILLAVAFLVLESLERKGQPFALSSSAYSSLYFAITGFHMLHVIVGVFILTALTIWAARGYFDGDRHSA
ncbi:MAG: cytochrome c oxidase subunit 3, partial [Candidatus Dormibacteraceae bacterium]